MGRGGSLGVRFPGAIPRGVPDLLRLPGRSVGVAQNDQHHRAAPQGVQETNSTDGDPARGSCMLSSPGLHLVENGVALAINPCRESAEEPAVLPGNGSQAIYTRKLTVPVS